MTFSAEASIPVADVSKQPLILLVLILGILTAFSAMSIDMYLPAFPQIARELGIPFSTVQLSISAFLFGSAAGQLFYGPLADRWGRRTPLLTGLTLYIVSAIGCACVSTDGELLFWRVVMAIGAGAGGVIARAVVRDLYNLTEAAKMFSMLMLVMGVAPILAPMVGGQILLFTGWRSIFGFLAIFGLLSLCLVAAKLPESLPEERRIRRSLSQMLTVYRHIFRNHQFLRYRSQLFLHFRRSICFHRIARRITTALRSVFWFRRLRINRRLPAQSQTPAPIQSPGDPDPGVYYQCDGRHFTSHQRDNRYRRFSRSGYTHIRLPGHDWPAPA